MSTGKPQCGMTSMPVICSAESETGSDHLKNGECLVVSLFYYVITVIGTVYFSSSWSRSVLPCFEEATETIKL